MECIYQMLFRKLNMKYGKRLQRLLKLYLTGYKRIPAKESGNLLQKILHGIDSITNESRTVDLNSERKYFLDLLDHNSRNPSDVNFQINFCLMKVKPAHSGKNNIPLYFSWEITFKNSAGFLVIKIFRESFFFTLVLDRSVVLFFL